MASQPVHIENSSGCWYFDDVVDLLCYRDVGQRQECGVIGIAVAIQVDIGRIGGIVREVGDRAAKRSASRPNRLIDQRAGCHVRIDDRGEVQREEVAAEQIATTVENVGRRIGLPSGI